MNDITRVKGISAEQKAKLIEILEAVFPQYDHSFVESVYSSVGLINITRKDNHKNITVQWLQLLFTWDFAQEFTAYITRNCETIQEASEKYDGIWDQTGYYGELTLKIEWSGNDWHPIDYLYELFKR